jgi:hypothetical protein
MTMITTVMTGYVARRLSKDERRVAAVDRRYGHTAAIRAADAGA